MTSTFLRLIGDQVQGFSHRNGSLVILFISGSELVLCEALMKSADEAARGLMDEQERHERAELERLQQKYGRR